MVSAIGYFPNGAVQSMVYGNGITQTSGQNSRLQTCSDRVTAGSTVYLDKTLHFTANPGSIGPCEAESGNNGNIWHIYDNLPNGEYTQHMSYDGLNRLTSWSAPAMAGQSRQMSYGYDSFGNMTQVPGGTPLAPSQL